MIARRVALAVVLLLPSSAASAQNPWRVAVSGGATPGYPSEVHPVVGLGVERGDVEWSHRRWRCRGRRRRDRFGEATGLHADAVAHRRSAPVARPDRAVLLAWRGPRRLGARLHDCRRRRPLAERPRRLAPRGPGDVARRRRRGLIPANWRGLPVLTEGRRPSDSPTRSRAASPARSVRVARSLPLARATAHDDLSQQAISRVSRPRSSLRARDRSGSDSIAPGRRARGEKAVKADSVALPRRQHERVGASRHRRGQHPKDPPVLVDDFERQRRAPWLDEIERHGLGADVDDEAARGRLLRAGRDRRRRGQFERYVHG